MFTKKIYKIVKIFIYRHNIERFIYIDDDNFITDKNNDFINSHSIVGKKISTKCAYTTNKWPIFINILKLMKNANISKRISMEF